MLSTGYSVAVPRWFTALLILVEFGIEFRLT
jgi:hypothetical protein